MQHWNGPVDKAIATEAQLHVQSGVYNYVAAVL